MTQENIPDHASEGTPPDTSPAVTPVVWPGRKPAVDIGLAIREATARAEEPALDRDR